MRPVAKPSPAASMIYDAAGIQEVRMDPLTFLRSQLKDTIGSYCSFCEIPIYLSQSVALKQVKTLQRIPALSQWDDLLLACDFCQMHRTTDVADPSTCLWPDVDASFSLQGTSPLVYALKDVTYVVTDTERPVGFVPTAIHSDASTPRSTKPMVIVSANSASPLFLKAKNTIELFKLNTPFYSDETNTFTITNQQVQSRSDPRVDLRTRAWINASDLIEMLKTDQAETEYPILFINTIKQIAAIAQASGFWSVWMTLVWQAFRDRDLIDRMLLQVSTSDGYNFDGFQTWPNGGKPPWLIFTGTAVDRLTF